MSVASGHTVSVASGHTVSVASGHTVSVASGHTVSVPGMSVAGLCAKFASTIKWHRSSSRGGPFWRLCFVQ